jgi:hypothetical protein
MRIQTRWWGSATRSPGAIQPGSVTYRTSIGRGVSDQNAARSGYCLSRSAIVGTSSGPGTSSGAGAWWSSPVSSRWNEADIVKIGLSFWYATQRRTENGPPVRMFSTPYVEQLRRVTGAHEVRVQGVHPTRRIRPSGRPHQRLPGHLAAEDAAAARRRAHPLVPVLVELAQVEQSDQRVDGRLPAVRVGHAQHTIRSGQRP